MYCSLDDVVGLSDVTAIANYPDKQGKAAPLSSNIVTITWTWGGIKDVSVQAGEVDAEEYVVLHVTDRDGFCGTTPDTHTRLNPVLDEHVDFLIDDGGGTIIDSALGGDTPAVQGTTVHTSTFSADDAANAAIARTKLVEGDECQAWILVSATLNSLVDVRITAFDPEGTVTFDVVVNAPSEPTPTADELWGDTDCDGDVDTIDVLGNLRHVVGFFVDQEGPCHAMGSDITVDGEAQNFGDWDCDGDTDAVDGLIVLLFIADLDGTATTAPCPDVGDLVDIS